MPDDQQPGRFARGGSGSVADRPGDDLSYGAGYGTDRMPFQVGMHLNEFNSPHSFPLGRELRHGTGLLAEIGPHPFAFAVDLFGGGSQFAQDFLRHGQRHFALSGKHGLRTGLS